MNAVVQSLREMSQMKIALLAGTAILLIGFFVFLSMNMTNPVLSPLYSGVSMEDSGYITQELDKRGIAYELSGGGTQIMVPTDQVLKLRVALAQQGIPSSGSMVGYEIFDEAESLGTSNFVLNLNKLRALEGELARTISSFDRVESARVHLVLPKRELFTRDKQDPSASVAIKIRGGIDLDKGEIAAIQHLVATAVPGLRPARITIVDDKGKLLARGYEDENDPEALAATAQEYRQNFENKLKDTVERLLEQSLGYGKVRAEINADIDFDRIVTNSETFDPESQVARSVQSSEETENSNERDMKEDVSVQNNLPDAKQNQGAILSESNTNRSDETTNFEISKVVENHVKHVGTINRLSVAVLVDGNYVTDEAGERTYQPRSADELAQIKKLVESSIGFEADRGDTVEVVNMQFAGADENIFEEGPFDWLKDDLDKIVQTLVMGGVAILVILLVVRPLIARAVASAEEAREKEEMEQAALLGSTTMGALPDFSGDSEDDDELISISRVKGGVKSGTYRRINEMIEKHPDEALAIIRGWAFTNAN